MSSPSRLLARQGEHLARLLLESQGDRVLAVNWRTRVGEIDLVSLDASGVLCFVEVKTRRSLDPVWDISVFQRRRLARLAELWLARYGGGTAGVRFDVVMVDFRNQPPKSIRVPDAWRT